MFFAIGGGVVAGVALAGVGTGAGLLAATDSPPMEKGWLHLGHRHFAPGGNAGRLIDWRQFGHSIRSEALKRTTFDKATKES